MWFLVRVLQALQLPRDRIGGGILVTENTAQPDSLNRGRDFGLWDWDIGWDWEKGHRLAPEIGDVSHVT